MTEETLVARLEGRLDLIAERIAQAVRGSSAFAAIPDDALLDELRQLARRAVTEVLVSARHGTPITPEHVHRWRARSAQRAREMVPLPLTVNGYLVGHQAMVEAIVAEAGEDPELCAQELEIFAVLAQYSRITTTAIVESYVETIEGERADRETDRRQFLEEVLSRRGADRASLARRAATLGLELGRSQVVVIVELARNGAPVTWTRQWCGDALARDCGRGRSRAFVVIGSEDVVAVLDAAGSFNARTVLNRVWRAAPMPEGDQLRAGIGSPFSDIEGFVVSFGEARRALRHTTPGRTIVVSPDEVTLLDDLALSARDTAERLISDRTRQALQDPSLRETLDAYVKANMNVAAAGEALIMHPNTVRYRLRRIAELTGRDPRRITDLFELRTAARILDASSDGAEVSQFAE